MAATRAGDDRAFERLYRRYQRRIAAYVHGMVNDHGRAEDITQEVFMSALRRMRETDRPIIFKPWVYEIAKNACIDAFRRSRRAEEVSYDADEGLGSSDYGRLVSRSPTPDVAVDTRMSLDHLRGAFGGLSEMHHDILVMRELEGLSYREIGRRLGMTRPSVESTLFRARRRLSEEYEELASGERCRRIQTLIADADGHRLGIRDERKMARHVSHCQPCRRAAFAAGFDIAALAARASLGSKVAALLPLPAFVKRRWFGGGGGDDGGGALSGPSGGGALTHWTAMAGQYAEPMSGGWAKAAAVAATMAVAGAGAGIATSEGDDAPAQKRLRPAAARSATPANAPAAPARTAAGSRAGGGATSAGAATRRSHASRPAAATSRPGAGSGAALRDGSPPAGAVAPASNGTAGAGSGSSTSTPSSSAAGGSSSSTIAPAKPAGGGPAIGGGSTLGDTVNRVVPKPGGAGSGGGASSTVRLPEVSAPPVSTPPVSVPKVPAATGSAPVDTAVSTATGAAQGATGVVGGTTGTPAAPSTGTTAGTTSTPVASDPVGTVTGAAKDAVGTVTNATGSILPGG